MGEIKFFYFESLEKNVLYLSNDGERLSCRVCSESKSKKDNSMKVCDRENWISQWPGNQSRLTGHRCVNIDAFLQLRKPLEYIDLPNFVRVLTQRQLD